MRFRSIRHRLGPAARGGLAVIALASAHCAISPALAADDQFARNTLPAIARAPDGGAVYRIVGGTEASVGRWTSMVAIHWRRYEGGQSGWCGGSVIDREWVLTAAHCVYQREARDFFIREGANVIGGGRAIDVTNIVIHEQYMPDRHLNDLALMHLASPASSPAQNLLSNEGRSELLRDRSVLTVVGYGLIKAQPVGPAPPNFNAGPASTKLLQVDVPLVATDRCARAYDTNRITDAVVCAGDEQGGRDSCQGDSGGPLYVQDETRQPVQAGVVSWGEGCAQAGKFGVYASVGYFEDWIRSKVSQASFLPRRHTGPLTTTDVTLTNIVGHDDTNEPSTLAQITVDVPARIRVGEELRIRVTSSVDGTIAVFNQNADGKSVQLFPNRYYGRNLPFTARAEILRGRQLMIPGIQDGFRLPVNPPTGMNRIVAVLLPASVKVDDLLGKNQNMQPIQDLNALLDSLAERELATRDIGVEAAAPKFRGVGLREYEIVR